MSFLSKLFTKGLPDDLQQQLNELIDQFSLPPIQAGDIQAKQASQFELKNNKLKFALKLPFACQSLWRTIELTLLAQLNAASNSTLAAITEVKIDFSHQIQSHSVQGSNQPYPNIKNIIAVASGKGGVGKSTTSVNLALALQQEGAKVGILDADIYGPSIPTMLGVKDKPQTTDGESMEPIMAYGLQLMSVGFLIEPDEPMVWRGPLVSQTLIQLIKETRWQDLDYLIIDLPPGTGDTQLTLSQQIPVTGAVVVTTPQEVSLIDARKGLRMFEKVNIPILGIVENMSTHICSNCGHEEAIFGKDGGKSMAEHYQVKFLGALPLESRIRQEADTGKPTVVADPLCSSAQKYREIALLVSREVAQLRKSYAKAFPKIEVINN